MILSTIQPKYDYNEVHSITVKSSVRAAFSSIKNITPSEIAPVMRMLICLRSFFERLACRKGIGLKSEETLLSQMAAGGFIILAENTPYEILLGMLIPGKIGRIWNRSSNLNLRFNNVQEFLAFDQAGYIRVMMNLVVK